MLGLFRPQPLGLRPHSVDRSPKAGGGSRFPIRRQPHRLRGALMAGLDGIHNKIDPGARQDLTTCRPRNWRRSPPSAGPREALEELEKDMDFLLAGDVFTRDQLESYMALKWEEVYAFEHTPHPVEYQMYYSC